MTLDFSRCRLPPFQHQREDVAWLLERPYAFIASEMRTGKSKIVVDASQFLYEMRVVDRVIVVAPAPVRDVWYDPVLGELAKHLWLDIHANVTEYHARVHTWVHGVPITEPIGSPLDFYVTNFEFLRSKQRLAQLLAICGRKTMLVLDESSFVKNHAAQQTKACLQLRRACGRVVLLNGTPIFHSPMDLFSQGNILHPSVLDCKFITLFRARYAVQQPVLGHGGKPIDNGYGKAVQKVVGWTNLDDLQRRFAPYTVRRLQAECLDLPPKLDPVTLTATLDTSWPHYKSMRDELVVWLKNDKVASSATAAVKALRLSQITGGFLGGVEDSNIEPMEDVLTMIDTIHRDRIYDSEGNQLDRNRSEFVNDREFTSRNSNRVEKSERMEIKRGIQEIGREKLDVLLWLIGQCLEEDPNLHLVAWCRFRAELNRMVAEVKRTFPQFTTGLIMGGQTKKDRLAALALLKPETSPVGPTFVGGIEGTGSFGLDMCAAHTCVTVSSGYSPGRSAQTLDRVYGPGQKHPIAYYDIIAVGPKGQKTIDRDILLAKRAGQDVATWTAAHWVKTLTEE